MEKDRSPGYYEKHNRSVDRLWEDYRQGTNRRVDGRDVRTDNLYKEGIKVKKVGG